MGMIQLPDPLQRVIDQQVANGRAASASALIEEAVMLLLQEAQAEESEIAAIARQGEADIEAGRYRTIASAEDSRELSDRLAARLQARLAAEG